MPRKRPETEAQLERQRRERRRTESIELMALAARYARFPCSDAREDQCRSGGAIGALKLQPLRTGAVW